MKEFFDFFTDPAIKHYERVGRDAQKRIEAVEDFKRCGDAKSQFSR